MKKVLIISGSPRAGGNSDMLCDKFLRGAEDAQHKVKKIMLRDKKIGYCMACDFCRDNNGACVIGDDMGELLQSIIDADVLVLASPVYFYSIDAQMKTLIDRCVARYEEIRNKEMYFILTAAEKSKAAFEGSLACFRGFRDCIDGAIECASLTAGGVWQVGEVSDKAYMQQAYDLGRRL